MKYHSKQAPAMVRIGEAVVLSLIGFILPGGLNAHAALLDGLFGEVEESLGEGLAKKGERLTIGNFYTPERPDAHGPIGTMGEHTHNEGEVMFSYRYMQMYMEGNRDGTSSISDSKVSDKFGFPIVPTDMRMEMHMFSAMWGVNDTLTASFMLPWLKNSMNHDINRGPRRGDRFKTRSEGVGDIKFGSLWRLYALEATSWGAHRFHFNFSLSVPTGDITPTDNTPMRNQALLPFPMRLGSGTYDVYPGLTYGGEKDDFSWGFQTIGTIRIGRNSQGYSKGNAYQINAFGAYRWADWVSTSFRTNWEDWENFDGQDLELNPNLVQTADPNLQRGRRLDLLGGINFLLPEWMELENRLAFEGGAPVYQDLNGPQLETDWIMTFGWQVIH